MRRTASLASELAVMVMITVLVATVASPVAAFGTTYAQGAAPVLELKQFRFQGVTYRMSPTGVALDAAGNIYVGDSENGAIVKFSPRGAVLDVWGSNFDEDGPMMDSPHGMVFDAAGNLYVANFSNDIIKMDPSGHEVDFYRAPECAGVRPTLCCVSDIAFGPDGRLYASTDDYDVYVFDPNDYWADTVFARTTWQGYGIAVDAAGRVYASDYDSSAVVRFLPSGELDPSWGEAGYARSAAGDGTSAAYGKPVQIRLDGEGNLLVVEEGSNSVVVLDRDGRHVTRWPAAPFGSTTIDPRLASPWGLTVQGATVLVADRGNARVVGYRFADAAGQAVTASATGSGAISISSSASTVRMPKAFVLSGALRAGTDGDACVVHVRKPGSSRWSYSSARLAYGSAGGSAKWWYRYAPKLRGTYSFYVDFAGDAAAPAGTSRTISVTVR